MKFEEKKYILENAGRKSAAEIAAHLHLKERKVRKFLEKEQVVGKRVSSAPPPEVFPGRKSIWSSILWIVLAGLLVYSNSFQGAFLWDDLTLVKNNPLIKDGSYWPRILTSPITTGSGEATNFYRPVQFLIYLAGYSLWQLNVVGYHLVSVVTHILAAVTLYGVILVLFRDNLLARLTALLFVVHPVHTEAVAYISGLADPLAALFMLGCLMCYLLNLEKKNILLTVLMFLSYAPALLSRENALILPLVVGLYHAVFRKKIPKPAFFSLAGMAVVYAAGRAMAFGGFGAQETVYPALGERLPGMFVAVAEYLRILIFPWPLHMEYGGILFPWSEGRAAAGILLFTALFLCAVYFRRRSSLIFFAILWFFTAWLPHSNIVPINAYMAEHWLYLPSVGFFLIAAHFLARGIRNRRSRIPVLIVTAAVTLYYGVLTLYQNRFWQDPVRFYERMLRLIPYSSKLYNNLAMAYHEAGRDKELVDLLRQAVMIDEKNAVAYNNLGNAYKNIRQDDEAVKAYQKAIDLNPRYAGAYYNLGLMYADVKKQKEEALRLLHRAVGIDPLMYQAYHKIGLIQFDEGAAQEALDSLEKALKINPDDAELYRSLGYIYAKTGDGGKAKMMYLKAIELNPQFAQVYHDLCVLCVSLGDYAAALRYCDEAHRLHYDVSAALELLRPYR